jgi:hypothetical protein
MAQGNPGGSKKILCVRVCATTHTRVVVLGLFFGWFVGDTVDDVIYARCDGLDECALLPLIIEETPPPPNMG